MHARAIAAVLLVFSTAAAHAQDTVSAAHPIVFRRVMRQRWLYDRQRPALTPFTSAERQVRVVGVTRDAATGDRILDFTVYLNSGSIGVVTMRTDARGHVLTLTGDVHAIAALRGDTAPPFVDAATELHWAIFDGVSDAFPALVEARVWDLVPVLGTDTLRLAAVNGLYAQTLEGVRTTVALRDTTVDGTRLSIRRDSAAITYTERFTPTEPSLDTTAVITRSGRGTIVGWSVVDPGRGLFRYRADTTRLDGVAELTYGDGRHYKTPARFERTMEIRLVDSALQAALDHASDSIVKSFSMVTRPEGIDERAARGDQGVIRALLDTVSGALDADARQRAIVSLSRFARDTATPRRLRAALFAAGDTASVYRALTAYGWGPARVDTADVAFLVPLMADPGAVFALGLDRDASYETLRFRLLRTPPAITADTAEWPCTPEACRRLAAAWTAPGDQRLRDIGLIAHLTLDPARWSDTVMARAGGDHFLDPAIDLLRGTTTVPAVDASWREWLAWVGGPRWLERWDRLFQKQDEHIRSLQTLRARTGRDVTTEWRAQMARATGDSTRDSTRDGTRDSTRLVFGSLLTRLGIVPEDSTAILDNLRAPASARRLLGLQEVLALFPERGAPVSDTATAADVQNAMLATAIDSAPGWAPLDRSLNVDPHAWPSQRWRGTAALAVDGAALVPAVRLRWARSGVRVLDPAAPPSSNERVLELSVSRVERVGPFLRVSGTTTALEARVNGGGDSEASGTVLYLVRVGTAWRVVYAASWLT